MWTERAACAGRDLSTFYLEGRLPKVLKALWTAKAKRVCADCPVRSSCLAEAMRVELQCYRYGIWGGLTPEERAELAKVSA
jgi:WhiB family redox-sensing transcriptional regulator